MIKTIFATTTFLLTAASFAAESGVTSTANNDPIGSYSVLVMSEPIFSPSKVWNDGEFTYVDIPNNYKGALPVVLELSPSGAQIMNYVVSQDGTQLKIHGVIKHGKLALHDQVVLIDQTTSDR